ncbi:MAG: AlkA N-terminal domain-containing protein [Acidimicrobiales bacterium]
MTPPTVDPPLEAWMLAVESRDARFDGWVIVGVTSTGIYCRPSCPTPVRPKRSNMAFFPTPASAQAAGFRACKRCAPDASPGSPEWNRRDDLVARAVRAVDDGVVDREGVDGLARRLHVSARHLHRLLARELGVGPLALARARRARTARALIETTDLAFSDVAFASGFESIRQFNDTIREVFAQTPTQLRAATSHRRDVAAPNWIDVRLGVREPFAVDQVWGWLAAHAIAGVEEVDGAIFRRSLRLPGGHGVVELEPVTASGGGAWIQARYRLDDFADLAAAVQASRRLLDLDADPTIIDDALTRDRSIAALVQRQPGLRSPGDVSGSDATIRAVLHQQVSLASARAMAARLVGQLGEPLAEPVGAVTTVFPGAEVWAAADPSSLGLTTARADTVVRVATALADDTLDVSPLADRLAAADAEHSSWRSRASARGPLRSSPFEDSPIPTPSPRAIWR